MTTTITIHGKQYPASVNPAFGNITWITVSIDMGIALHDYIAEQVDALVSHARDTGAVAGYQARSATAGAMALYCEVTSALDNADAYWITTSASVRVHRDRTDEQALTEEALTKAAAVIEGVLRDSLTQSTANDLVILADTRGPLHAEKADQS